MRFNESQNHAPSPVHAGFRSLVRRAYQIRGIGLGRVCEFVRKWAASRWPGRVVLIDDFRGGLKFHCRLDEHMGSQIFWRGAYSGNQLDLLQQRLRSGATFFDIGANQGEFSVYAAHLVGPAGRVVAFEPVSALRDWLEKNVAANGLKNVAIQPVALGDQDAMLPIYGAPLAFDDGTDNAGLPTLHAMQGREQRIEEVPVRRLDDLIESLGIERVDVMKLDIEGSEFAALRGAENLLVRFRPTIIFEVGRDTCAAAGYQPKQLLHWLAARGFRFALIGEGGALRPLTDVDSLGVFQNILAMPVEDQV